MLQIERLPFATSEFANRTHWFVRWPRRAKSIKLFIHAVTHTSIYRPIGDRFSCHGVFAIFPKLSSKAATGRASIADSKPRLLNERLTRE